MENNSKEKMNIVRDYWDKGEMARRESMLGHFKNCPIPDDEILANLGLFISKSELARTLYLHELYRKILDVHGVIMEFGVRWGQNLALFEAFRGIYEPFNRVRKIVGFDTFEGFPSVSQKDGKATAVVPGAFGVTKGYETYLDGILSTREKEGAVSHVQKYELVKGDASATVSQYLERHPETIISLAYFDFDIYAPTKACLEAIRPYVTKGTVIAFDELNMESFPGETVAVREVLGLDKYRIVHTPYSSNRAYLVIE